MNLTAEMLQTDLFSEVIAAGDQGFTMTKTLGTLEYESDAEGNPLPEKNRAVRDAIAQNAAAVRKLAEQYPDLQVTFPQTVVSEKIILTGETEQHFTAARTDAVITVPESFVQVHTGTAFRQLVQNEWASQFTDLTGQIAKRLRKHEMRTAKLFGENPDAASAVIRVTDETVESEIWTLLLAHCGFYPLQWDGEICGMAILLAERLKETLAADCGSMLETTVRRYAKEKFCTVTVYYSIKQD